VPPLTDAEQIDLQRDAEAFWTRCQAAGYDEHMRYATEGAYRTDPERAEQDLATFGASYVPPPTQTAEETIRASYGITEESLAKAQDARRSAPILHGL
jgi:hypothetical protein